MKKTTYHSDFSDIDFKKLKEEGWKNPYVEMPSPTSYREVILIKRKHGGDVDCIVAGWYPTDNYKSGFFQSMNKDRKIEREQIYLWREVDFLTIL